MNTLYLLGIGHNTPVFIDLVESCGYTVIGLYHYNNDRNNETLYGFTVLGSFEDLFNQTDLLGSNFILTMGDNLIRTTVAERIRSRGGKTPTLIHPTAIISRFAKIAEGVVISPFTYVQANTEIGQDTIILSGVNISHNNKIGKGCFIAGGATVGAYTTVGDHVFIGQGALTISEKVDYIGNNVYIGARTLVTKSIHPNIVVAGQPARQIFLHPNKNSKQQ